MKNVRDFAGSDDLTWTQPKALKQAFELRAGEDVVGTLEFRNSFGSFATGESADGRWTFKRQGFFRPRHASCAIIAATVPKVIPLPL